MKSVYFKEILGFTIWQRSCFHKEEKMAYDQILKEIKHWLKSDFGRKVPLYLRISQAIEKTIRQHDFNENEALPSERDLATFLEVSRITIRKSIENLEQKAIVARIHGRGTFVKKPIQQNLKNLSGFTEEFRSKSTKLHQEWLMRKIAPATDEEAFALNIAPQSPLAHLKRIRYINHMPLAVEHAVIPRAILKNPKQIQHSLYQFLRETKHAPTRALQKISAQNCTKTNAQLLKIPPSSAILYIERRSFDPNDTVIEFVRSLYRSDLYELIAELHISHDE